MWTTAAPCTASFAATESGAPALSLRAVARAVDMSPAGLYRYYDGRDALLTALLVDAYGDLADAVEQATTGDGGPLERLRRGIRAYRAFAVADPNRFLLVFGTPIPGYAAPEDGPTVAANRRMGMALFAVAADAVAQGLIAEPPAARPPTSGEQAIADAFDPPLPTALVPRLLGAWAHWHGLVLLEITGQLDWAYPDTAAFFEEQADAIADALLR